MRQIISQLEPKLNALKELLKETQILRSKLEQSPKDDHAMNDIIEQIATCTERIQSLTAEVKKLKLALDLALLIEPDKDTATVQENQQLKQIVDAKDIQIHELEDEVKRLKQFLADAQKDKQTCTFRNKISYHN